MHMGGQKKIIKPEWFRDSFDSFAKFIWSLVQLDKKQ